eukprot:13284803-Ditylum_brightwellii.AAC.1
MKLTSQPYHVPDQAPQEWKDKFRQLVEFKQTYGNCNVPLPWNDDGALGTWLREQKHQFRLLKDKQPSSLTVERIDALLNIGVNLCSIKLTWQERFQQLLMYKTRYGNCNVPQGWKENPSLAIWVNEQRKTRVLMEKGQKSCMSKSRIDELDRIGFEWSRNKLLSWEERFAELRVNGRLFKEGKKSNITQARVEELDSI